MGLRRPGNTVCPAQRKTEETDMKKAVLIAAAAGAAAGMPWKIDWSAARIRSRKIRTSLRICVISDLHATWFGMHQHKIADRLKKAAPDLIVIPGDLFDEHRKPDASYELLRQLHDFPVFFAEGNHERRAPAEMRHEWYRTMRGMGVQILRDEAVCLPEAGVEILGLHCMHHHPDCHPDDVSAMFRRGGYRILLSHRHHFEKFYAGVDCDLVISGHAHGGQWRIPGLNRGIYAPQSGFFPAHTGGMFENGSHLMLVSRGLNRTAHGVPRLFNNPEIWILDLLPVQSVCTDSETVV